MRSARERTSSGIDGLTRVHRRDLGLIELRREIARAERARRPLTLAFVDIDHLKRTNDSLGHAAGDQLLRDTTSTIKAHLRPYDLIIRYGGDEFLCALPELTMAQAAERFELINADLAATYGASVTAGLTELLSGDVIETLIGRADEAMYRARRRARAA